MGPAEGAAMLREIWKIGDWSVFPAEEYPSSRRVGGEGSAASDGRFDFLRSASRPCDFANGIGCASLEPFCSDGSKPSRRTFSNCAKRCAMDAAGKRRRNISRQCQSAAISSSLKRSSCALRRPRSRSRMPFLLKVLLKLN